MTTNVYIDGFNLYNGCIKATPFKWLDLRSFAQALLGKSHTIGTVSYFTARVLDSANDPNQSQRQGTYIRALEEYAGVTVLRGYFSTNVVGDQRISRSIITRMRVL